MPDAFPAVTVGESSSGWMGLSSPSVSTVTPRRGCSSTLNVRAVPSRSTYSTGTISSSNAPESIEAIAWPWLYAAHSSTSRRVRPISRAVFSPTVIDMSNAGASGVSGWLGDIHICGSPPGWRHPRLRRRARALRAAGDDDACPCRHGCCPRPSCTALRPDAQWRLSAMPGALVSPRTTAVWRAMSPPP